MGLFGDNTATDLPLASDPPGGEVEPELVAGLAPSPTRVGLYGDHGDREAAHIASEAQNANLALLARSVYDGLAMLEFAVRRLDKASVILGPYVWTPADTKILVELPSDRMPVNAMLSRIVGLLTDASVAAENLTITDLLPIAFSFKPASVLDESITDDAGIRLGLPIKAEHFALTKKGGGAFTTTGALYLHFTEGDLK